MSKETRLISVGTLLLLSFLACRRNSDQHHSSGILGELEEAYRTKITVSKLGLSKGENFLGNTIFYVKGTITNSNPTGKVSTWVNSAKITNNHLMS